MIVFAPRNEVELRNILYTAQLGVGHPIAIRYPRGTGSLIDWKQPFEAIKIGTGVCLQEGKDIAILSLGTMSKNVTKAIENMSNIAHYDMRFAKPLDENLLHKICTDFKFIITVEDGLKKGGFGTEILAFASENKYPVSINNLGLEDAFITHGTIDELQKINGIDPTSIETILKKIQ
jgi:1-deoxy-D-xylulose-5-phosphate synthase